MKKNLKMMLRAAIFAALTAVGAFIKIPLGDLSVTLQVMFSLMSGLMLGAKWGAISQAIYVGLGFIGIPIFTGGGGPQYALSPSFGFLLGLILLSFLAGLISKSDLKLKNTIIGCIVGLFALYAIGIPYMYVIMNAYLGKAVTFGHLLVFSMLVYLPFDAVKIVIAIAISKKVRPLLDKQL